MKKWLNKENMGLRLLALLLGLILWAYVVLIEPGRISLMAPK